MTDRGLDEEKLRTLAGWAAGLRTDQRPEVAAAGRAIELLIEEVERLHVLLWDLRLNPGVARAEPAADAVVVESDGGEALERTLRERLAARLRGSGHPHA